MLLVACGAPSVFAKPSESKVSTSVSPSGSLNDEKYGPTLADRAAADNALRSLSLSAPATLTKYNSAVREFATHMQEMAPDAVAARLNELGISLCFPVIGKDLPPHRFYIAKPSPGSFIPGAGVPMIIEYDTKNSRVYPVEGLFVGVTAIYRNDPATPGRRELRLIPYEESRVTINGASFSPARDVNAAGLMLARRARRLGKAGLMGLLRPERAVHNEQIYILDPYDPNKIPLLMTHGLQSTPLDFACLVNSLRQDPVFRQRYQIWQFYYTSGTPVLANALMLRESLDKVVHEVDPDGRDFATNHIVALGHSMGGILSHTLVVDSGNLLWDSIFRVSFENLKGSDKDLKKLAAMLKFRRNPRVARVIFIAVPHRGSPIADSIVGRLGNMLIQLPAFFRTAFTSLATLNPERMTPAALIFYRSGRLSSIRTLSPRSTSLRALAEITPKVPFHSIIGQTRPGPKERGSDGVVPYTSSHMPGADSELIVRAGHVPFRHPDAVKEIIRILHLQAGVSTKKQTEVSKR